MKISRSAKLFAEAQQLIPGGVNSPVRAFRSVGGQPRFIARAKGSRLYDVDKNVYIDYVLSWGPMILGHAHPAVIASIKKAAGQGTSYGAPTELEVILAREIRNAFPSMEKIRLVSSGTEAAMSAIRVARGFTKRNGVMKFEGCYHGHSDYLLREVCLKILSDILSQRPTMTFALSNNSSQRTVISWPASFWSRSLGIWASCPRLRSSWLPSGN